ncbi:hypothetical protein DSO57_1023962 [Entomophthora muscae]|uniref:Uncharacterized protein n=1 Tax=Entomophthora muscae TaxID=34485 RepID=A0ACC2RHH5_9FUNG|nr:hypothetical protein DSO57_1023962 [Entomophthora muscae]
MTPPLTPRLDCPLEPPAAAKTTSTQLFGVLYITLKGWVDSMVPNSGPWSLLGQSISYIIKLAPILWWALPAGLATPHPKPPNASAYDWPPENTKDIVHSSGHGAPTSSMEHYLIGQPQYCNVDKLQLTEFLGRRIARRKIKVVRVEELQVNGTS